MFDCCAKYNVKVVQSLIERLQCLEWRCNKDVPCGIIVSNGVLLLKKKLYSIKYEKIIEIYVYNTYQKIIITIVQNIMKKLRRTPLLKLFNDIEWNELSRNGRMCWKTYSYWREIFKEITQYQIWGNDINIYSNVLIVSKKKKKKNCRKYNGKNCTE